MGSAERSHRWDVYDGMKTVPTNPFALMAEINEAIGRLEFAQATTYLKSSFASESDGDSDADPEPKYDARLADEAYRAGCASLAAGKLDEALQSMKLSLSKCPPDKSSAVAKLQSLISLTSKQLRKSSI